MSERNAPVSFREVTERFWVLRQITEVRADGVYVRLAPLERSFKRIPATDISRVELTTYDGSTYAGWHWGVRRTAGGNMVYRLIGDRGVEVTQSSGERWFIGSQRPDDLAAAMEDIQA